MARDTWVRKESLKEVSGPKNRRKDIVKRHPPLLPRRKKGRLTRHLLLGVVRARSKKVVTRRRKERLTTHLVQRLLSPPFNEVARERRVVEDLPLPFGLCRGTYLLLGVVRARSKEVVRRRRKERLTTHLV